MTDLRNDLRAHLRGRVCLVGIGNPDQGDDALGVRLAEGMLAHGYPDVIIAARTPECCVESLARGSFQAVLFVDAVEMGALPGAAVFLESHEMATRYPQVSTHKISLGTLAGLIERNGRTRVFLLGVQPESAPAAADLSAPVKTTLAILQDLLAEVLPVKPEALAVCGERP
jgi:hydrogenase maturation protease